MRVHSPQSVLHEERRERGARTHEPSARRAAGAADHGGRLLTDGAARRRVHARRRLHAAAPDRVHPAHRGHRPGAQARVARRERVRLRPRTPPGALGSDAVRVPDDGLGGGAAPRAGDRRRPHSRGRAPARDGRRGERRAVVLRQLDRPERGGHGRRRAACRGAGVAYGRQDARAADRAGDRLPRAHWRGGGRPPAPESLSPTGTATSPACCGASTPTTPTTST